jgi:hypothetical protein
VPGWFASALHVFAGREVTQLRFRILIIFWFWFLFSHARFAFPKRALLRTERRINRIFLTGAA